MNLRKGLLAFSCILAAVGLIAGMGSQLRLAGLVVILMLAVAWIIKPVRQFSWLASVSLALYLSTAAVALILGGEAIMLALGSMAALAAWDLTLFDRSLKGGESSPGFRRCIFEHLKSLGLALGLGIALMIPILLFQIQLPFIVMLIALAVALAGLLIAFQLLQKKNTP